MEYTVYVKANEQDLIFSIDSSDNLTDTDGWIEIDKGVGDKYKKAQTQYLGKRLFDDRMILRYKLVDGVPTECTPEEIAAQEEALKPAPTATDADRLEAQVMYTALMTDTLLMEEE